MIVLDASAVVELLSDTPLGKQAAERIVTSDLHAPHLLVLEVAQVLRRREAQGALSAERAAAALVDLRDLGVTHHGHLHLMERVWALRHNLTAYDASFVALAEALEAKLITCDGRLAAARGHRAEIELID